MSFHKTKKGHLTFNKTCCEENGVSEGCMILCKRDTSLRSLVPPNDCAKWEDTIAGCVVNGMIYLKNDYILIFLTRNSQTPICTFELYLSVY